MYDSRVSCIGWFTGHQSINQSSQSFSQSGFVNGKKKTHRGLFVVFLLLSLRICTYAAVQRGLAERRLIMSVASAAATAAVHISSYGYVPGTCYRCWY